MSFDTFISYSSKDKTTADATCNALESAGIRCWIAPRDIRAGIEYAAGIMEGIDACRVMVLIFSANANASPQIHREIERAVSKGLTIIPFRIEEIAPTKAMEYYLGSIHWLDALTPPLAQHLGVLVEQVKANLQVEVEVGAAPRIASPIAPSKRQLTASARLRWSLVTGLIAIVALGAGTLALWQGPSLWTRLSFNPTPVLTTNQHIFLNLLRASYDEPLSSEIPTASISLQKLDDAIHSNYPRELLFWLFIDRFEYSLPSLLFGFSYNPPQDLGCDPNDPKHRCYIDWIHLATLGGLTVEGKTQYRPNASGSPSAYTYRRYCFDSQLARGAGALAPTFVKQMESDVDVASAELYAGPLECGYASWQPEQTAMEPQPEVLPLIFRNGMIRLKIIPRSAYGLFEILGTLIRLQRQGYKVPADKYPESRPWVANVPPGLATAGNEPILTVTQSRGGSGCFVSAPLRNFDYCVPDNAVVTKQVFGFLNQLLPTPLKD